MRIGRPKGYKHSEETKRKIRKSNITTRKYKNNNRWFIYSPEHLFARDRYVPRYRLVMEKKLKRYLRPIELVHHINGDKSDDRSENLYLLRSLSAHTNYHNNLRETYKKWGKN